MAAKDDIPIGAKFGRLTVMSQPFRHSIASTSVWCVRCRCDCGNEKDVYCRYLLTGNTKSCGCLHREKFRPPIIHGMAHTTEAHIYQSMMQRCYNPKNQAYKDYGGRGVTICDRWRAGFKFFLEDMGRRPAGLTIDRKDNSLGYSKGNCRWATYTEQNNNRRSSRMVEFNGRIQTAAEWSRELGISQSSIGKKLRRGLSLEQIISSLEMT